MELLIKNVLVRQDECSILLRNVDDFPDHTASHPKTNLSSEIPP
jgi:hypothetical protein